MTPNLRLAIGALVAGLTFACSSPPQEAAHTPAPVASSRAPTEAAVPEQAPTTFAGVAKLLERADGERDAARKDAYALARNALGSLTGVAGRPAIVADVKTEWGTEETRLLPENRKIEASSWQSGMRVAGERVARVGKRLVSLDGGRITIWDAERKRVTLVSASVLEVPEGEPRFALVRGKGRAFVLDTETGEQLHESSDEGAMLLRTAAGVTRFAHLGGAGGKASYEILELPSGKQVASWSGLVAADGSRGLVAVSNMRVGATGAVAASLAVVRVADGTELAVRSYTLEKLLELSLIHI